MMQLGLADHGAGHVGAPVQGATRPPGRLPQSERRLQPCSVRASPIERHDAALSEPQAWCASLWGAGAWLMAEPPPVWPQGGCPRIARPCPLTARCPLGCRPAPGRARALGSPPAPAAAAAAPALPPGHCHRGRRRRDRQRQRRGQQLEQQRLDVLPPRLLEGEQGAALDALGHMRWRWLRSGSAQLPWHSSGMLTPRYVPAPP